ADLECLRDPSQLRAILYEPRLDTDAVPGQHQRHPVLRPESVDQLQHLPLVAVEKVLLPLHTPLHGKRLVNDDDHAARPDLLAAGPGNWPAARPGRRPGVLPSPGGETPSCGRRETAPRCGPAPG